MRVAILSESDYDTVVIIELVRKICTQLSPPIQIDFVSHEVGGTITTKMSAASALFFVGRGTADLAIFGVDLDGKKERRRTVNNFVRKEKESNPENIIIPLFIQPHLEELFFAEGGNAIKTILTGLDASQPLPYRELDPKSRLRKLIKDYGPKDLSLTAKDIYAKIAAEMDPVELSRNHPDFKRFQIKLNQDCRT